MRRQSLRRFAFLPLVAIALFGGIAYTAPQSDQSDRGVAPRSTESRFLPVTVTGRWSPWPTKQAASTICARFPHGDSVRRWWTWVRSGLAKEIALRMLVSWPDSILMPFRADAEQGQTHRLRRSPMPAARS
jgi:hypothetical protein